jgi:hypothetical protein
MMGLAGWIRRFASHKHIDYCGLFQINTLCIHSVPGPGLADIFIAFNVHVCTFFCAFAESGR